MASLHFDDVVKRYEHGRQHVTAIHGLSANIDDGEFVVIVGPSGCGKSTLLRMVAGLEAISAGTIRIGDRVVNDLEPAARDIAMVFQNYALYPHMTVYDNMAYGLKLRGVPREEIRRRVEHAARILELSTLLQRKPRQLSGGQRQRVAMGRAIVRQPQVFLFDEPLSNLDAKLRVHTRLEIQKLHRELGITSLFVTHDQVEAMTLAQRVLVMNAGRMEQFGTPEEVYHRPATTFVATFIGSPAMNLLREVPGARTGVVLGVRPEHLRVVPDGDGWPVTVEAVELLGAERLIHGRTHGQPITVRVAESDDCHPGLGATLHVRPLSDRVHSFDPESGRRMGD
ncbi:sn-glycerol-3-phosphate ABC transporter ATP-binding protein UgpC [Tepidimonas charontis]|uniref:sn-glycerol-3-phosphate import ATP-binding protein UgpC n=1 Tax=Tepidimonas charontis TaxID=2267262 RepID=A0A554XIL2_9BURK|nr:sn-glycerol-3-phosphate ABC transporter ATP-binding protein UgpC [Tepidimonas charontis]TSE35609.1 sn-glycerol-3-phosphate import ATP-binding protein UgpC [Tepidimonas charontis]